MAHVIPYTEIEIRDTDWVIPGFVPRGELTVLAGLPGLGKSMLSCRWAADLSQESRSTLLVSVEDSPSHTIKKRLIAAEAQLEYVFHPLSYPVFDGNGSVASFARIIDEIDPAPDLIVLDPFTGMMSATSSSWNDQHVRLVLAPLATFAGERDLAIVYILHLNKTQAQDPMARIGGSVGLTAAARSVCLFGSDTTDPSGRDSRVRLLAHVKCNVAELAPTQIWELEPILIPPATKTARLSFTGLSEQGADDLLRVRVGEEEQTERDEAREIIVTQLISGPMPSSDLEHAVREAGISPRTYDRARRELGVRAHKKGKTWYSEIVTKEGRNEEGRQEGVASLFVAQPSALEVEGRKGVYIKEPLRPSLENVSQSPPLPGSDAWYQAAPWHEIERWLKDHPEMT